MNIGSIINAILKSFLVYYTVSYWFPQFTQPWWISYFALSAVLMFWERLWSEVNSGTENN